MDTLLQDFINGLQLGSMYALIALGYTMVYGILRLINFAHGDVFMVGAFVAAFAFNALHAAGAPATLGTAALVMLISMAACALLGVTIERLAYRPLRGAPRIAALITAIGVSLFLENFGVVIWGATPRAFPTMIPDYVMFHLGRVPVTRYQVLLFVLAFVLMAGLQAVTLYTRVGKAMRAVSFDADAARLMGINVDAIIAWTFTVGSALAAAAGVLFAMNYPKIEPYMGIFPGLKAFVAAVLGGIGNIPGAMVGGLIMGLAEYAVIHFGFSTYKDAVAFALLVGILIVRPTGVMGKGMVEKV